jgi:glycosyltransferase involved in cell wall biosynthesis
LNPSGPPHPDLLHSRGVSAVIPAFNYAHFLPAAIASVLAQNYSPLELIVVDDGSTDDTAAVVAAIADPRLRCIRQENAGLSASRNTGIRESRFPYVAFLDADDTWDPAFLAVVMKQFAELPEDFCAIATGTSRMDAHGNPRSVPDYTALATGELTVRDFCMRNRPFSSSVVVKRHTFAKCGGFDAALRSSEDRDMWIRLTAHGHRFYYIDRPLAFIRRHPENMSKNAPRMKRNSQLVLARAWRAAVVPRLDVAFWLRAFSIHFFLVAWTHFDDGLHARALLYWLVSVALWPVFLNPRRVFEPPLFRLRALAHFLLPRRR